MQKNKSSCSRRLGRDFRPFRAARVGGVGGGARWSSIANGMALCHIYMYNLSSCQTMAWGSGVRNCVTVFTAVPTTGTGAGAVTVSNAARWPPR